MDVSDVESVSTSSTMDAQEDSRVAVPGSQVSRLQQKIEVVQQVVTILEQTMAQGKSVFEKSVASIQSNINILVKTLEGLRAKSTEDEVAFNRFSEKIGGEINRFCALDNILRTVEESQSENDVKILLPDISDLDPIIQRFSAEKLEEWRRLKEESRRLNTESKDEEKRMKSLTLKVTLRKNLGQVCPDVSANAAAQLLNSFMGKSMIRDTVVKYIRLSWDEKSFPPNSDMFATARRLVHQAFSESVILNIEEFSREQSVANNFNIQDVWLQGSQRLSLQDSSLFQLPLVEITGHRLQKGKMRIFQIGTQDVPQSINDVKLEPINYSLFTPQDNPAPSLDDEIQIVREIKRTSKVLVNATHGNSISSVSPTRATVPATICASTKDTSIALSSRKSTIPITRQLNYGKSPKSQDLLSPEAMLMRASPAPSPFPGNAASLLKAPRRISFSPSDAPSGHVSSPTTRVADSSAKTSSDSSSSKEPPASKTSFVISVPARKTTPNSATEQLDSPFDADIFAGALLKKSVIKQMQTAGLDNLLEFQSKIIEAVLTGRDVFCLGSEGVGKTLVFVLSTLQKVDPRTCSPQVFYITSTSLKAEEVLQTVRKYGGGTGISYHLADPADQKDESWEAKLAGPAIPHLIVGTLPSVLKMLSFNRLLYDGVTTLVLDDVDEMIERGFHSTVIQLVYNLNASIQTMVSSKLKTEALEKLCNRILRNVVSVTHFREEPRTENSNSVVDSSKDLSTQLIPAISSSTVSSAGSATVVEEGQLAEEFMDSSSVSSVGSPVDLRPGSSDISGDESDVDTDSDVDNCPSPDSDDIAIIEDLGFDALHLRRNSTEEIESLIESENVFSTDDSVMTFIPGYVLRKLGIPMMMNYDCSPDHKLGKRRKSDVHEPHHMAVIMDSEELKIQTISLLDIGDEKVIIFCNSADKVEFLATQLRQRHLWPQTMHEDLPKAEWIPVLRNFSRGKLCKLIVATDFMGEVTLQGASYIINYDYPIPARNYISRCAFASRHVDVGACPRHPYVISFITKSNLESIDDLRKNFGINIQLQPEISM